LVKQYGDGLAETIGGLVHTARYGYYITVISVQFHSVFTIAQNILNLV